MCAQPAAAEDLALRRLINNTTLLSLQGRAALALALQQQPPGGGSEEAASTLKMLVQGMLSDFRVAARTAYIATGGCGGAHDLTLTPSLQAQAFDTAFVTVKHVIFIKNRWNFFGVCSK